MQKHHLLRIRHTGNINIPRSSSLRSHWRFYATRKGLKPGITVKPVLAVSSVKQPPASEVHYFAIPNVHFNSKLACPVMESQYFVFQNAQFDSKLTCVKQPLTLKGRFTLSFD